MIALAQGIALGGTIFLLLVLGLLYQWKKGGETRRLKRWMFTALVITAALFFFCTEHIAKKTVPGYQIYMISFFNTNKYF